ncbi:MAG: hypothetical protein V3W41_07100 [Planctomycetota bacterium]
MATNRYCEKLGIKVPRLEEVIGHREANIFSLMMVTLMERGHSMSLDQIAERFEEVGFRPRAQALASLKRCRPNRDPIFRDGDLYALDPNSHEADLWAFRLGLRPPRAVLKLVREPDSPLPNSDTALGMDELKECWTAISLCNGWSTRRIILAVLDARQAPMLPAEISACVASWTSHFRLGFEDAHFERRGSPIHEAEDGRLEVSDPTALIPVRLAVRARIKKMRAFHPRRNDEAHYRVQAEIAKKRQEREIDELASLRRVFLHAYPMKNPEIAILIDATNPTIRSFLASDFASLRSALSGYDLIAAVKVRETLSKLGFDFQDKRLSELSPPQKSMVVGTRGHILKITLEMLIQSSCRIRRPLSDPKKLKEHLGKRQLDQLLRRLESDAKSIFSYFQYGRLHGVVLVRKGAVNESLLAPWRHFLEPHFHHLKKQAYDAGRPLEVVFETPAWDKPWASAQLVAVDKMDMRGDSYWLIDQDWTIVDESEIQAARITPETDQPCR